MNKTQTARLDAAAAPLGATVEVSEANGSLIINVDAPSGRRWVANDCHSIHYETSTGRAAWVADTVTEVVAEIELGLRACDETDCETCSTFTLEAK